MPDDHRPIEANRERDDALDAFDFIANQLPDPFQGPGSGRLAAVLERADALRRQRRNDGGDGVAPANDDAAKDHDEAVDQRHSPAPAPARSSKTKEA